MPVSNPSELVSFDADDALEAIQDEIGKPPRSLVEYDGDTFNPLYVDDETLSFYEDEDAMLDHFDRIHSYVHVDFTEIALFTDELFPISNRVEYIATGLDVFTLVRVYVGSEGLFVAVDTDDSVDDVVAAIRDVVREPVADESA